jgi:hypothetical protein
MLVRPSVVEQRSGVVRGKYCAGFGGNHEASLDCGRASHLPIPSTEALQLR